MVGMTAMMMLVRTALAFGLVSVIFSIIISTSFFKAQFPFDSLFGPRILKQFFNSFTDTIQPFMDKFEILKPDLAMLLDRCLWDLLLVIWWWRRCLGSPTIQIIAGRKIELYLLLLLLIVTIFHIVLF